MAIATKPRRRTAGVAKAKNGSDPHVDSEFTVGSLEAAPAQAWAKLPADYFANLDHYLHGAPKKG